MALVVWKYIAIYIIQSVLFAVTRGLPIHLKSYLYKFKLMNGVILLDWKNDGLGYTAGHAFYEKIY